MVERNDEVKDQGVKGALIPLEIFPDRVLYAGLNCAIKQTLIGTIIEKDGKRYVRVEWWQAGTRRDDDTRAKFQW